MVGSQDERAGALQQRGGPAEAAGRQASVSHHVAGRVRPRLAERLRRRVRARGLRGPRTTDTHPTCGRARGQSVQRAY